MLISIITYMSLKEIYQNGVFSSNLKINWRKKLRLKGILSKILSNIQQVMSHILG